MNNLKKLEDLLPKVIDGSLSSEDHNILKDLLEDKECLKTYEEYIDIHSTLIFKYDKAPIQKQKKTPISYWLLLVATAAIIVFIFNMPTTQAPIDSSPIKIAQIKSSCDALYEKTTFEENSIFDLKKGIAELEFPGVDLIVEAPAKLKFISAKKIKLFHGSVSAKVRPNGVGFTVDTEKANIIDLGTEFCVKATKDSTEVHVTKGSVEAKAKGKNKAQQIKENQAVIYEGEVEKLVAARPDLFVRVLPGESVENPDYIHWSFDEIKDDKVLPTSRGIKPYEATIHSKPIFEKGKVGNCATLDGIDDYFTTNYPGIGGSSPRTVAFWVKIPPKTKAVNSISMLAWGSYEGQGKTFQISWNWLKKDGRYGALRAGLFHGQATGSKDIRDGKWHHAAIVIYGGGKADVSTHIFLYLDGELHKTSRKSVLKINTDINSKHAIKMLMGRDAKNYFDKDKPKTFKGSLDEVFVFNGALSGYQIRSLMKHNSIDP